MHFAMRLALRSTRWGCYNCVMGTQGLSGRVAFGRRGGDRARHDHATFHRAAHRRLKLIAALALLPIAAGCSSSPPWSSSANPPNANQAAAVQPPPNYQATAAGQPAYAPPPGQQAYTPPTGQPGYAPPPGQPAYAPPPQQAPPPEQSTAGSFRQSYVGFLQMFRDPPEQDPAVQNARPATPPAQQAYAPRPPSTYAPSQQPYAPPQGQGAYPPPPAQQNYAPAPSQQNYAPRRNRTTLRGRASRVTPRRRLGPLMPRRQRARQQLPLRRRRPAGLRRLATVSETVARRLVPRLDPNTGPTQTQTVPHPPSTYTPSGQPYSPPPGQQANGAPPPVATAAAAPPPANPDPANRSPIQSNRCSRRSRTNNKSHLLAAFPDLKT